MILHGDCCDLLPNIPAGLCSLVVTSPPYRAGKEYETQSTLEEYRCFAEKWVSEIPHLLSDRGSFWLNVGYTKLSKNETLPLTYLYYPLVKLKLIQEIVWHYEGGMSYKKRFTHRTERWMWFAKNPDDVIFNLDAIRDVSSNLTKDKRNNLLGKNPTDYWYFNRVVGGRSCKEKVAHPCQFPEKMIERIILACTNEGDLVVDPFVGSGTTAVVSNKLGRKCIGIEQNPKYVEIAKLRLGETSEEK